MSDSGPGQSNSQPPQHTSPWAARGGEVAPAPARAALAADSWTAGRDARKATDLVTVLLLVAVAAAVAAAAGPAVLRAVAAKPPPAARQGLAEALRRAGFAQSPIDMAAESAPADSGLFDPTSPDLLPVPHRTTVEELRRRTREALQDRGLGQADSEPGLHSSWGLTGGTVILRSRPELDAPVVDELDAGQAVLVVREQGSWLLIAHRAREEVILGWVERERIVVPKTAPE